MEKWSSLKITMIHNIRTLPEASRWTTPVSSLLLQVLDSKRFSSEGMLKDGLSIKKKNLQSTKELVHNLRLRSLPSPPNSKPPVPEEFWDRNELAGCAKEVCRMAWVFSFYIPSAAWIHYIQMWDKDSCFIQGCPCSTIESTIASKCARAFVDH